MPQPQPQPQPRQWHCGHCAKGAMSRQYCLACARRKYVQAKMRTTPRPDPVRTTGKPQDSSLGLHPAASLSGGRRNCERPTEEQMRTTEGVYSAHAALNAISDRRSVNTPDFALCDLVLISQGTTRSGKSEIAVGSNSSPSHRSRRDVEPSPPVIMRGWFGS